MRILLTNIVLAAIGLSAFATAAQAQFWPGYGYFGGYGAWGAYAAGMENNATRYIASQNRMAAQAATAQRSAMMQSEVQNMLTTQAERQTQNILNQQQSNRDWWFQVQQQQLAQQRAASSASLAAPMAVEATPPSPAATDVIRWPPVLCESRFAAQRALVEAPYRRAPKGEAVPTAADYENMIKAAEQMQILLGEMTSEISAQAYLQAEKFIGQLTSEARQRLESLGESKTTGSAK